MGAKGARTKDGLTMKQELFSQEFVSNGGNATAAYRKVYNVRPTTKSRTVEREACKVLHIPIIEARIAALQERMVRKVEVTIESLTSEYDEIRALATGAEQYAPAISAVTGKAKLHGFLTDKTDITTDGKPIVPTDMSDLEAVKAVLFAADMARRKEAAQETNDTCH